MRTRLPALAAALVAALFLAACAPVASQAPGATPGPTLFPATPTAAPPTAVATPTAAPETVAPSVAPTAAETATPAPATPSTAPAASAAPSAASAAPSIAADCQAASLTTVTPGKLTVGTDNPAYPPYFEPRPSGNTPPWDASQGDPTDGQGFESAVAYAIANALGFTQDNITWVVVPFTNSYAPGQKSFDFDVNQVSYTPDRAQTADLSDGYYFGNQAVVTLKNSKFAKATTITELQGAKLGAQIGTTSYDAIVNIIKPTTDPQVFDSNDAAVTALKIKQIDAIVVDLPTADLIANVEVDGVIVGQLAGATPEHFSAVLTKGSSLTACVNQAIAVLTANGTLDQLVTKWLPFNGTPALKP